MNIKEATFRGLELTVGPDAVTQIVAPALKSGNGVVLKGGSEAARTTEAIVARIRGAIAATAAISSDVIGLLHGRAAVNTLLELDEWIDLVVPRGSSELVRAVRSRTVIPVPGHADGNCHIYVDRSADPSMACAIVVDSKVQCIQPPATRSRPYPFTRKARRPC